MLLKTLRLTVAMAIAMSALAPTVAGAQHHRGPAPYSQAGYPRDGYAGDRAGYDRDRRMDSDRDGDSDRRRANRDRRDYRHCDRGTGGTLLGAIAGGLLGNAAVGRHGNNTAGALAGAGVGALAGNAIDRDC